MKEIKIWLIRNGLTQAELARQLGTTRQNIYRTLSGRRPNPRMRRKLEELGVPARLVRAARKPARRAA